MPNTNQQRLFWFIIGFWVSAVSAAQSLMPWKDPAYISRAFIEIAFKREYQPDDFPLAKWDQSVIYYQIQTEGIKLTPSLLKPIQQHLKTLHTLTGIRFIRTHTPENSQLKIWLIQDRYFKAHLQKITRSEQQAVQLARKSNCFATFKIAKNAAIQEATVIIPADHAFKKGLYLACVVEEITQIMGLPNDADWVSPSIANDLDKQETLSPLDRLFLQILYDPSLKPGMDIQTARPHIRRIIHHLLKQPGA